MAIAWGVASAQTFTRTHNDEDNLPILNINRRLGSNQLAAIIGCCVTCEVVRDA